MCRRLIETIIWAKRQSRRPRNGGRRPRTSLDRQGYIARVLGAAQHLTAIPARPRGSRWCAAGPDRHDLWAVPDWRPHRCTRSSRCTPSGTHGYMRSSRSRTGRPKGCGRPGAARCSGPAMFRCLPAQELQPPALHHHGCHTQTDSHSTHQRKQRNPHGVPLRLPPSSTRAPQTTPERRIRSIAWGVK